MATRKSSILTIIKAEDIPTTEPTAVKLPSQGVAQNARKKVKKTSPTILGSAPDTSIAESSCKPSALVQDRSAQPEEPSCVLTVSSMKKSQKGKTAAVLPEQPELSEITTIKIKKIIPPHPARTPEEAYKIVKNHAYKRKIQRIIRCVPVQMLDLVCERMRDCTGRVANNLVVDKCHLIIGDNLISIFYKDLEKLLSVNPSIIVPTWNVLTDNTTTIREKLKKLYEIGWTADVIPESRKGNESHFMKIYLLAQLLEHGIQRTA